MPGPLDFLFEGRAPASIDTWGQTVESIPKWLSDYTQGLIGRANIIAGEEYQPYGGPRIAGFHPDQMAAFDVTREGAGSWIPAMQGAGAMFGAAANQDPLAMAAPFLQQSGGRFTDPGNVESYMDPYIGNVLQRQADLSNRNLTENIIPGVQDMFIGSGSFGGDRMAEIGTRAMRDTAEGLQGQQMGALSDAYRQAGTLYGQDMSRILQTGLGAGTLAGQTGELQLAAGQQMGNLGSELQRLQYGDAAALEAIGSQQRQLGQGSLDLAYNDFLEQRGYPRETVDWMSQIIRGLPSQGGVTTRQDRGPADVYGPSPLSQIASLYSAYRGFNPQTGQPTG
tara:strand:- start:173 stop:1186 length:1014 start_codon:yes stop_codon:yes gene_type:complete